MPRFTVEWEWRIEWFVEAESKEAAEKAAKEDLEALDQARYDAGDPHVSVFGERPSSKDGQVDAVAVGERLFSPDDEEGGEEWDRLVELEEQKKVKEFLAKTGNLFPEEP